MVGTAHHSEQLIVTCARPNFSVHFGITRAATVGLMVQFGTMTPALAPTSVLVQAGSMAGSYTGACLLTRRLRWEASENNAGGVAWAGMPEPTIKWNHPAEVATRSAARRQSCLLAQR